MSMGDPRPRRCRITPLARPHNLLRLRRHDPCRPERQGEPLRVELLERKVLPQADGASPTPRGVGTGPASADPVGQRAEVLEGFVAKPRDSRYEQGLGLGLVAEDARQPRAGVRDRRGTRSGPRRSMRSSSASSSSSSGREPRTPVEIHRAPEGQKGARRSPRIHGGLSATPHRSGAASSLLALNPHHTSGVGHSRW